METTEERLARLELRVAALEHVRTAPGRPATVTPRAPRDDAAALEARLGTYWLSRLGIVSLITGVALVVITYFGDLVAIARVVVGYAMAGGVAWAGWRLRRRHRTFGELVFGGGLAIAYFVTYALHFVPAMRVVHGEILGIALVAVAIASIVVIAHRMQSETVAGIALFLGLHTGTLNELTALSLIAMTLLAAGAGFFLAVNRWVIVPLSTVLAVYVALAAVAHDGSAGPPLRLAFVIVDAALFAVASLRHTEAPLVRTLALANWFGALLVGGEAVVAISARAAFVAGLGFAAAYGVLALAGWRRRAAPAYVALHVGLALATLALALPAELDGGVLVAGWLALALAAAAIARHGDEQFAVLAIVLLGLAYVAGHDARLGWPPLLACVAVAFAAERLHAPRASTSRVRLVFVAGIAAGLLHLARVSLPGGYQTLATVGAGTLMFALGFALRAAAYRWAAFALFAAAAVRFVAHELGRLSAGQRILTFVLGGLALLAVSFAYSRRATRGADRS